MKFLLSGLIWLILSGPLFAQGFANGNGYDNGLKSSSGGSGTVATGTIGNDAIYTGTTTTGSGTITDTGGVVTTLSNVGIGTGAPTQVLQVVGNVQATGFIGIGTGVSYTQGNLGIGSTNPGTALDVVGTVRINNLAGFSSEYNIAGNIGLGTTTVNWNNGNNQNVGIGTSSGAYIAFTHPTGMNADTLQLRILEDATGSRVITGWPATVKWQGGSAPTLSGANKADFVNCFWNGTTDYCQSAANF